MLACAALSSCATKPVAPNRPPENSATAGTQDNVRFGEVVKAYPIERYRDPADPRMMHEKHVVYRVEETPAWKMQANRNQQLIVGNLVTDNRSTERPVTSQELTAELNRSRAQNNVVLKNQAATAEFIKGADSALRGSVQSQDFTLRKMAALQIRVDQLEAEKKKMEEAKKAQATPAAAPQTPAQDVNNDGKFQ